MSIVTDSIETFLRKIHLTTNHFFISGLNFHADHRPFSQIPANFKSFGMHAN